MLFPYVKNGRLTLLLLHRPETATGSGDRVTSVTLRDLPHGRGRAVTAKYFLEATELGDLLPLTKPSLSLAPNRRPRPVNRMPRRPRSRATINLLSFVSASTTWKARTTSSKSPQAMPDGAPMFLA
jgi:FAD dependent oxidoreductase